MDWIKKNYDKFTLVVLAVVLIGVSAFIFLNAQGFAEKFADSANTPNKVRKMPDVDTARITKAKEQFDKPLLWDSPIHDGLLFTSKKYYLKNGVLVPPKDDSSYSHSYTGEKIPNLFFLNANLPLMDQTVPFQDPDGDGFNNEDEWKGKTDPLKKESHPPYYTQLFLMKWNKVPFLLKFQAYDGEVARPAGMTFQINTLSLKQPSEFLKIGDTVANTKFKLIKFQFKEQPNAATGEKDDVSELTLLNTETSEEVVLTLNKVADSPNQSGDFEYRWGAKHGEKGQMFRVPKFKVFVLKPEVDKQYKLLDLEEKKALIQTPAGEKYEVLPVK